MNKKKLEKIKLKLEQMLRNPHGRTSREFNTLATQLGRKLSPTRNNEPTWVREIEPELSPPMSIPNHPGDMALGTARNIIHALLSDVDTWEMHLHGSAE